MSRRNWKAVERSAAAIFGCTRFPANMGGRLDFRGNGWVGQVKNPKTMSLAMMEALALEMEEYGAACNPPHLGCLVIKRSAGAGKPTPMLIVVTESVWREMNGALPHGA